MGGKFSVLDHAVFWLKKLMESKYYFTYCEAGFCTKTLGDVILTVGREGAVEMLEEIPL